VLYLQHYDFRYGIHFASIDIFKKDWKKTIAQNRHISIILGIHDL